MNKKEFLNTLEEALTDFNEKDKKEILYDYEEHFRIGEENGKDEDELIKELGDPQNIAEQYKMAGKSEIRSKACDYDRPMTVSVIAAAGLLFFNLVFIVGPYMGIIGVLIGLFASAAAIMISGIAIVIGVFIEPFFIQFIHLPVNVSHVALLFIGVGTIALGALFLIGMVYLSKLVYKGTVKYISWNMKIVKG